MAKINFFIVAGNTAPAYAITCTRDNTAIDLSTASAVTAIIQKKSSGTITQTGKAAVVTTAASGLISYTADATDFPSKGIYKADIKITWATGIEILYNQATWKVREPIS